MRQLIITILFILTLIQNVKSQEKVIKGDTAFWYDWNQELVSKLELKDFNKLQKDFAFRFWSQGQVVEIIKDNNHLSGQLTNYIYHSHRKRSDTIINKIILDSTISMIAYDIIQKSGVLSLPSDENIKGWAKGFDGITYIIEHSDKKEYWYKNYWTPSTQDSIPESLTIMNFVDAISDTLQLSVNYKQFRDDLPHKGCYNSGGLPMACYLNNAYRFGYYGSVRLYAGLHSSIYLTYIGKKQTDFGLGFYYKTDLKDNYALEFDAKKTNLFLKRSKCNDFLVYGYGKRKLDFVEKNTVFKNHKITYGISLNGRFNLSTGIDYMLGNEKTIGGILSMFKYIDRPKMNVTLDASIFKNDIDYKIGVSKYIDFNRRFNRAVSIGLYYENFKDYNDLNFKLTLWI